MGTQSALLAKDALADVPVVFAAVTNPVPTPVAPIAAHTQKSDRLCQARAMLGTTASHVVTHAECSVYVVR